MMLDLDLFFRRSSRRLNGNVQSVQVYSQERLVAVIMNQDRYLSADYAQKVTARRRVYRKTHNALSVRTVRVLLPGGFTESDVQSFLDEQGKFPPIFFERTPYGKSSVCISPRSFRLLRKTAAIKMSCKKLDAYIAGLPLRRKDGKLVISGELREI